MSAVFYFGTVGVLDRGIDGKIMSAADRLDAAYGGRPLTDLAREIDREIHDGVDSDLEIFLLISPTGRRLVGDISTWRPPWRIAKVA